MPARLSSDESGSASKVASVLVVPSVLAVVSPAFDTAVPSCVSPPDPPHAARTNAKLRNMAENLTRDPLPPILIAPPNRPVSTRTVSPPGGSTLRRPMVSTTARRGRRMAGRSAREAGPDRGLSSHPKKPVKSGRDHGRHRARLLRSGVGQTARVSTKGRPMKSTMGSADSSGRRASATGRSPTGSGANSGVRRLALFVSVALTAVACGGGSAGDDNPQPPSDTAVGGWEGLLIADDDGVVTMESALDAFVVAIGPLPGVERPEIGELEAGSGTAAVRAVLSHWDELTTEQRAAVTGYLTGDSQSAAGLGPVLAKASLVALAAEPDEQQLVVIIDQLAARIAQDLGRQLSVPIELRIAPELVNGDAAAFVAATDASGGLFGPISKCSIVITKAGLEQASEITNGVPSDDLSSLLAHEVFHCFEAAFSKNLSEAYARPGWVVEGLAEWVGASYANSALLTAWQQWLETPSLSLFKRAYSAIGFWAHLQEHGAPVWQVIDPVLTASNGGSLPAYELAIASSGPDVLQTWGPGAYRDPTKAPNWDQDGPGILDMGAEPTKAVPLLANDQSWSVEIGKLEANIWDTDIQAQVATLVSTGPAMMLLADDTELSFPGTEVLCTIPGGCTCPSGSPGAAAAFRVVSPGPAHIGLAGHLDGTTLTANGWSLEDFCEEYVPAGMLDACLVGEWTSIRFSAADYLVEPGTGVGVSLVVGGPGVGYIDFSEHEPVILQYTAPEAPVVRVLQEGAAWLSLAPAGARRAVVVGGATIGFSVKGQVDFGGVWVDAGPGIQTSGSAVGTDGQIECDRDGGLRLGIPNDSNGYFFERVGDSADIPPEPSDAKPLAGAAGPDAGGGVASPGAESAPPGWGLDIDACGILTTQEIAAVVPNVQIPTGEDDLSTQFSHQCSFLPGLSLQITPPAGPAATEEVAEYFAAESVDILGVTDWGRAVVDDWVIMIAGGNDKGTVTIVVWVEVALDTAQYDGLVSLLKLALSRL